MQQTIAIQGSSSSMVSGQATSSTLIGWQTYHNDQYGFSIQYPVAWSIDDVGTSSDDGNSIYFHLDFEIKNDSSTIRSSDNYEDIDADQTQIEIYPALASETPIEGYERAWNDYDTSWWATSTIMVDDTSTLEYAIPGMGSENEALLIHDTHLYGLIQISADDLTFAKFAESFKFDH